MKYTSIGLIVRYDYKTNRFVPWLKVETNISMTKVMSASKVDKKKIYF
jgi:hypothetical protein